MKDIITNELSKALKNGDKERLHTLRLIIAAIKDKEIASRSSGAVSYTHLTLPTKRIV